MCGRFDVDQSNREIDRLLSQLKPGSQPIKLGEVFPTNAALTLYERNYEPAPEAMAWGFPRWDGKGVIFNARAESALQKGMFAKALRNNPAVIPATGFYEWRPNPQTGRKDKFIFRNPDHDVLYMAGFWSNFADQDMQKRFIILTTGANQSMRAYHDRMPVLLTENEISPWLNRRNLAEILANTPHELVAAPA